MSEFPPYRIAVGHDVAWDDMDVMLQQPFAGPVAPVERHYGIGAAHYDDGLFLVFRFDHIETASLYVALLEQFGLNSSNYADVCFYAKNDRLYWRHYNGVAHRPEPGVDARWNNFFWRDIEIYITDMEEIA